MRTMHYVTCALCRKQYYVESMLARALAADPKQKLKCPFCRKEFQLERKQPDAERNEG